MSFETVDLYILSGVTGFVSAVSFLSMIFRRTRRSVTIADDALDGIGALLWSIAFTRLINGISPLALILFGIGSLAVGWSGVDIWRRANHNLKQRLTQHSQPDEMPPEK